MSAEYAFQGNRIVLIGKTRRGKNKIREHGEYWDVVDRWDCVQCLDNKPGILVVSIQDQDVRWVAVENDSHFDVAIQF